MRGAELYREYETIPPRGPLAALTVPGAISGWMLALEAARSLGARLPLPDLLGPAIRHASDGYTVTRSQARLTAEKLAELKGRPRLSRRHSWSMVARPMPARPSSNQRSPQRSIISPMPGSMITTAAMSHARSPAISTASAVR